MKMLGGYVLVTEVEKETTTAGGKLSTWLPPGNLAEHNSNARGAVTNRPNDKENKTEQHNQHQSKHCLSDNSQTNEHTTHSNTKKAKLRTRTD